jgi:glycosyltransferase involved in cell wall biosynthesis
MQPAISVIIPTLDEEDYLPNLLKDLIEQTNKDFEVIVVDAKSTDTTKEKAEKVKKQLALSFIESPKAQVSFQRNLGAQNAKANYLFFSDADTRLDPNVIERLLMHIRTEKGLLYLPLVRSSKLTLSYRFLVWFSITAVTTLTKLGRPMGLGPHIVIEKKFFNKLGGFNEKISASEDHNLVIKAAKAGVKATFLKDVVCVFSMRRFDSQGIVKVFWQYALFAIETVLKGAVYTKDIHYDMGGQDYKKENE